MTVKPIVWVLFFAALAATVPALPSTPPARAQAPQHISVVLIIDNSGSMAATDPASLRFVAASQLVDLLEDGDEISVILFADDSTPLVPLTKVTDAASKEAIKASLVPVTPEGNTNMRAGLEAALAQLEKGSNPIRFALFLTDGELHPPDWDTFSEEQQEAERTTVFSLASSLGEKEWALFPISLASAVEPEFLQQLADNGGGVYRQAPQAGDVTLVFQEVFAAVRLDVFEVLLSDCLAPGQQSSLSFPVHQFVSTLSLFVTYTSDLRPTVTVTGPDGQVVSPTGGNDRYDAYSIQGPARGTWSVTITGARQGESCLSISSTPRTLVDVAWLSPPDSLSLAPGEPLEVTARLTTEDPQSGEQAPVEGAAVTVTVTGPNGKTYEATLDDAGSGEYTGTVAVDEVEGTYEIALVAETEEGEVARRSFQTSVSLAAAEAPSPTTGPTPPPTSPPAPSEGDGGPALLLLLLGPVGVAAAAVSFGAYCRLGRPVLRGWLQSAEAGRAYNLESRHRHIWWRRPLTVGGPKDDIDLGLAKRRARLIARRGGECYLQATSGDVVVDGHELKRRQRRQLHDGSDIDLGGVGLVYRLSVGGPRIRV